MAAITPTTKKCTKKWSSLTSFFAKTGNGVEVPLGLTISYVIQEADRGSNRIERGLEAEGGLYRKGVRVRLGDEERLRRKEQVG